MCLEPRFCSQSNPEELSDPYCVEESPTKITFEDVTSAAFKIKCGIINTPCVVRFEKNFKLLLTSDQTTYQGCLKFRLKVPLRFRSLALTRVIVCSIIL